MEAIIDIDSQSSIGFRNVYEDGDEWIKIRGCDSCPEETRKKCCIKCPSLSGDGLCLEHYNQKGKPLYCVTNPTIKMCVKHCSLTYMCTKGSNLGKIRRVKDNINVLVE